MKPEYKIFLTILAVYGALWLPGLVLGSKYMDSAFGLVAAMPFISIYLFHMIGIPFLLEHNGACGWGWCAPTLFGWIFLIVFWLGLVFVISKALARMGSTGGDDHV